MKKKSKKKKDSYPRRSDDVAKDVAIIDQKKEDDGDSSRHTSRGRRSLSSLFRRSAAEHRARSESPEKSKSASAASEQYEDGDKQESPSLNPKVNPRRHLGRMTVREALVDSKLRRRSPHRTIVKLQKSVLDNQPRESLSASLPHILDQFPDPTEVKPSDHETPKASGHTLPRSSRRSRAERRASKNVPASSERTLSHDRHDNKMLPLDKRKYLIDQNNSSIDIDATDSSNIIKRYSPTKSHYSSRDISPYNHASFLDQENMRRESFGKFLQLRETKPASHSSSLSIDKGSAFSLLHEQSTSPFEVVIPEKGSATEGVYTPRNTMSPTSRGNTMSPMSRRDIMSPDSRRNTMSPMSKPHSSQPFPNDHDTVGRESKRKSIFERKEDIPDLHEQNQGKEMSKHGRTSYISPRRFSRNSKSSDKDTTPVSENKTTNTDKDDMMSRYHRQFSNSSEKAKQIKNNAHNKYSKSPKTDVPQDTFIPPLLVDRKPDDVIYKKPPDEVQKYSMKEVREMMKIIETQRKVQTQEDGTQTEEYTEPIARPSVLTVRTVVSSTDIPNIKQENMFVPITDDLDDADDVFLPAEALLTEDSKALSAEHLSPSRRASEGTTPSDIVVTEDKHAEVKDSTTEKTDEKERSHSKKGKKKSEKKKKKSKDKDSKKHGKKSKGDEHNKDEAHEQAVDGKKDDDKHKGATEDKSSEIERDAAADKDENESDKHRKGDRKLSKKQKKLKKTMSMKVPKGKSKEPRPLAKSGRAASLSDIPKADLVPLKSALKSSKGKRPLVAQRSRSVEDLASSDKALHDQTTLKKTFLAEKKEAKKETDQAKGHATKEVKQPKLSIAAIVAIRAKISRMKKAKQLQAQKQAQEGETSEDRLNNEANENQERAEENRDEPEVSTTDDVLNDRVYFENEINASIGKSESDVVQIDENILSLDKEVKDIVYDRRIHFSSFCDDTMSEEEMIKQRQRNTRLTSRRESKVRQRQKKLISCCKKAIAFLFSHIGLCSLVIGYCIAGGFIFKSLEGQAELAQREKMENVRLNYTEKIFALAFDTTMEKHSRDVFRIQVERILKNYSQIIFKHTKEAGWDGNDNYGNETAEVEQWSFPSSLLYAITVMTTIGYGHVAPKTTHGRIVTIAYAVLGIPLTLLCLTNIGDVMAHGFRLLYGKVFCGLCCVLFRPARRKRIDPEKGIPVEDKMIVHEDEKSEEVIQVPTSVCLLLMSAYILLGTWAFCKWEGWDVITGTYFCFITLSTIGFGDVVPGMSSKNWNKNEKLVLCGLYLLFGLSLIAMCFNLVQEDVKAKAKRLGKRLGIIDK